MAYDKFAAVDSSTLLFPPTVRANLAGVSPNVLTNGAMDIWQRGTSFSGNVYTADRWVMGNSPSAVSRSTDVPNGFTYSLDITGSNHLINQRIESVNATLLYGQSITVSFYAKSSSGSNTMTVAIGTPSATDNFATQNIEYTSSAITITSSWARYSVTFSALSSSITKGAFIYIYRNGATGTDRTLITGVQLEAGAVATPFRRNANSIQGELAACQRYYYRVTLNPNVTVFATALQYNSTSGQGWLSLPVTMRVIPTAMDSSAASNFRAVYYNGSGSYSAPTLSSLVYAAGGSGVDHIFLNTGYSGSSGFAAGWLDGNNTNAYLGFTAEL